MCIYEKRIGKPCVHVHKHMFIHSGEGVGGAGGACSPRKCFTLRLLLVHSQGLCK